MRARQTEDDSRVRARTIESVRRAAPLLDVKRGETAPGHSWSEREKVKTKLGDSERTTPVVRSCVYVCSRVCVRAAVRVRVCVDR